VNRLVTGALVLVILAGAGGYAWHAWDTGKIPGNPRAPLKENFEKAVLAALALAPPEDTLCHPAGFRGWRGEDQSGMQTPGQFGITLVPELGGEQRLRQVELLQVFSKAGYFSEKDTTYLDESGTSRAAKRYQLTLAGWYRLGMSDCLEVGQRSYAGITKTSKIETNDGTQAHEITFEMKVKSPPAWATDARVEAQFRQLKTMTGAMERKAKVVRTKEGWDARLARVPTQQEQQQNPSAPPVYLDSQAQPKVPPVPTLAEATRLVQGAPDGYASSKTACLMLPQQHNADAVGDIANQDRERPYYATYYDDPAKMPAMNRPRADGLGLMRALQSIGLVDEEPAPDTIINGMRHAGGATFRLKQQYKVLLDPRRPGCLPVATITPEVKALRWRTMHQGNAEPLYSIEVAGVAKASDLRSWVKESGADAKLPMVKAMLEEGLPYGAYLRYNAKEGWQASTGTQPSLQYATEEKPAALFGMLPRLGGVPAASASEAHAIVVYEGRGPILVSVAKTASPVELFLSSQRGAQWRLQMEPGARLKRVVAMGAEPQQVSGVPAGVASESSQSLPQRGMPNWLPFPSSPQQVGMVTERLSQMTNAPVRTIQTVYAGTQFRISPEGKSVAGVNPTYTIPGANPYAPPIAVRAAPSGIQARSVAIPAEVQQLPGYQEFMQQEMMRRQRGGAAIQAAPAPMQRGQAGAPTPKLGMARCGGSTIVCQAGAETAMCNGQPVPCR
jgi:hypothetical protein